MKESKNKVRYRWDTKLTVTKIMCIVTGCSRRDQKNLKTAQWTVSQKWKISKYKYFKSSKRMGKI